MAAEFMGLGVTGILMASLIAPAVVGMLIGSVCKSLKMANISASFCAVSCIVGMLVYVYWLLNGDLIGTLTINSPLGAYAIKIDCMTALMLSISSAVFFLITIHVVKSVSDSGCRYCTLLNALYVAVAMCMIADSVILLLIAWETITAVTYLMCRGHDNEAERRLFFIITHIGGLILICVYLYLWSVTGTPIMSQWSNLQATIGTGAASLAIAGIVLGFGTKLGLVPFHAWTPGLYGTSPTHTVALLSTVCSNVAVLVMFKTVFGHIGVTNNMAPLALTLLAIASFSAIWGSLESLIQREPKRTLAYSSMENMSLVVICMALSMSYTSTPALMELTLVAALLHTINHSVFKALMLLSIDTVEDVTGETMIDRLGGISKALPLFSAISLIGVLALAAIPPMNGFVSEWLMIQSLVSADLQYASVSLIVPLVLAVVGICGMMMAASYARLFGFIFLGRPRSEGAAVPKRPKKATVFSMTVLAVLCIGFGVFALPLMNEVAKGVSAITGISSNFNYTDIVANTAVPLLLGLFIVVIGLVLYAFMRRGYKKAREVPTWGCGVELNHDMQYSSAGFIQPLIKVFHPFYGDMTEIVDYGDGNKKVHRTEFLEPFLKYLYRPIVNGAVRIADKVGKIQTGNIQSYFLYILLALMTMLMAVRLI